MSDRRTFLRGLVSLPLIGGGVTLIGQPAAAVPLIQAAALPGFDDPRQRMLYAFEALSAAASECTAGADGWIISAVERWTPLPGPYKNVGSKRRLQTIHYVEEHDPRMSTPLLIERHKDVDLGDGRREGWL